MLYLVLPLANNILDNLFTTIYKHKHGTAVHYPRAILEFRGLGYHTNTVFESKKLEYESGRFHLFYTSHTGVYGAQVPH